MPNGPISVCPAILTDSLEEVPTGGRDFFTILCCPLRAGGLTSNYFSIFEMTSHKMG